MLYKAAVLGKHMAKEKYLYIRAWGMMMHSMDYYIEKEIDRARKDKAPTDAIFYSPDDIGWRTWSGLSKNNVTKQWLADRVKEMQNAS